MGMTETTGIVKYQPPIGSGAMALEQYAVPELTESKHDLTIALGIKSRLSEAGFGFDQRPWLVSPGTCHFPAQVADQINYRAWLFGLYLPIAEGILNEKFGGPPTKLWGLPYREKSHGATIIRFDDILMPNGQLLATEAEGWSSGQGQIIAMSNLYRLVAGKDGLSTPFGGIDLAAVKTFKESFGEGARIAVVLPKAEVYGLNFLEQDFKLFCHYCRQLGLDISVESIADLEIEAYDVLYPFFPPTGYADYGTTLGKGKAILKAWVDGKVELFPEPSWLQTKLITTAMFELQNSQFFPDAGLLFPWSWPLDKHNQPNINWSENTWVAKPLFGTDCSGLVFSSEMGPNEWQDFVDQKLQSFKSDQPYPLQFGEVNKHGRTGANVELDFGNYFIQPELPHANFKVKYLNPSGSGIRQKDGFGARICSTVFIDNKRHVEVGDVDVTLRKNIRVHGATDSVVTLATFG